MGMDGIYSAKEEANIGSIFHKIITVVGQGWARFQWLGRTGLGLFGFR